MQLLLGFVGTVTARLSYAESLYMSAEQKEKSLQSVQSELKVA